MISFRFAVEIDGITHAGFQECSAIEAKTDVYEYKEGGLNGYTHKLPGQTTYSNVTLKYGVTDSSAIWDWYSRIINKKDKTADKRQVSIVQYDSTHKEVLRWNLADAFPVKWTGPTFDTTNSNVDVATLELAFGDLTVVKSG